MADLDLSTQGVPTTPAAGRVISYPSSVTRRWTTRDEFGKVLTAPPITNANTTDQVVSAADNYLAGSALAIPPQLLQVGAILRWVISMTKSGAGTAAPVWIVRFGTGGVVGDAARLTFTSPHLQTAVIDAGRVNIDCVVRSIGAAGVVSGVLTLNHNLQITGLAVVPTPTVIVTSGGFDMTVANLFAGVSVNPGASGVWTHQVVHAELRGM